MHGRHTAPKRPVPRSEGMQLKSMSRSALTSSRSTKALGSMAMRTSCILNRSSAVCSTAHARQFKCNQGFALHQIWRMRHAQCTGSGSMYGGYCPKHIPISCCNQLGTIFALVCNPGKCNPRV